MSYTCTNITLYFTQLLLLKIYGSVSFEITISFKVKVLNLHMDTETKTLLYLTKQSFFCGSPVNNNDNCIYYSIHIFSYINLTSLKKKCQQM